MAIPHNTKSRQIDDVTIIQNLLYNCIIRWRWFALSLLSTFSIAIIYILTTPSIYIRTASILIKEDSKGQSLSKDMESFIDFGLLQANTNVNNEIGTLQSPDIIREVVKRLHLNLDYHIDERFKKQVVYGSTCPIKVSIIDLPENESAAFTIELMENSIVRLFDFEHNNKVISVDNDSEGRLNDTIVSPIGKIVIIPTQYYTIETTSTIFVSQSSMHNAITQCASALSISQSDEKSSIINLKYTDVSTQRAEDVLNTLIAVYNGNWVKDRNQIALSTSMFINDRLNVIENELGTVDNDISSYKSKHLLPDVQAVSNIYMIQAKEASTQIMTLNDQVYMARYIRNYLTNEINKYQLLPANTGIENSNIEDQITEYNNKLLQRNRLIANSSIQNPLVVDMDAALVAIKEALTLSIDNQLVALNAQLKSLEDYGNLATNQISSNPKQAKYLLSVERQQKVKEALYLFLLQKREENELSQAFTAYNTRIIALPHGTESPTAPIKRNILSFALIIGLILPIIVIFIRETLNTTIRSRKDLENTPLPLIGEIPFYIDKKRKNTFFRKQPETNKIVVKEDRSDRINEAFRVLRTNIEFMADNNGKSNIITITSFNQGSGKTFLTMNIAISFAIKSKKVLIIDGDMRHGTISTYVGSHQNGLSSYLSKQTDNIEDIIVQDEKYECLHILPVGIIPPNPTELLFSERLEKGLDHLRNKYDYILIDCPPIEVVADTQIIDKLSDRTIFVVRAGLLERNLLTELQNIASEQKLKNISLVLNGTNGRDGYFLNRYGYGYNYLSDYDKKYTKNRYTWISND